ncbi:MAG: beta strand repeat-containing protein, partial [Bacteroidia bacterium]
MKKTYLRHFPMRKCNNQKVVFYVLFFIAGLFCSFTANSQAVSGKPAVVPQQQTVKSSSALKNNDPDWIKNKPDANAGKDKAKGDDKPHLVSKWKVKPFDQKIFIENKGQFNSVLDKSQKVLFQTVIGGNTKVYFLPNGVVFRQRTFVAADDDGDKNAEKDKKGEKDLDPDGPKTPVVKMVSAIWEGANPDVTIEAGDEQTYFAGYATDDNKGTIKANLFKKITYKNIYPGIDLEYVFPDGDKEGIEYTVIVHPGADLSQVKLNYAGAKDLYINGAGSVMVPNDIGVFTDHAPKSSFLEGGQADIAYVVNGTEESFVVKGDYDKSKTLLVDPWTQTNFGMNKNDAYDIDYDNYGNVFVGGGFDPYYITKLNSAGAYQWTFAVFSTDNTNGGYDQVVWGSFAVDKHSGEAYAVEGFNVAGSWAEKLDPNGNLLATYGGTNTFREMWRAEFNACTGNIAIGGGGTNSGANSQVAVLDTTMASLSPANPLGVSGPGHDVVAMSMDPTGSQCFMAVCQSSFVHGAGCPGVGCYNGPTQTAIESNILFAVPLPTLSPAFYTVGHGYNFGEDFSVTYVGGNNGIGYSPNTLSNTNGINGMSASPNWLYMWDGYTLKQFNKGSGALNNSLAVSGVVNINPYHGYPGPFYEEITRSGLAADGCDNVYVGEGSTLATYNSSLVNTSNTAVTSTIYAIKLGLNDLTLYVGGNDFVQEFANPISSVVATTSGVTGSSCGLANGSATANLQICGATPGGISYSWSPGGQTTQTATNLTGGITYTVTMSIGCGVQYQATASIAASSAPALTLTASPSSTICSGTSTTLDAGGGTGYTWSTGAVTTSITVSPGSTTTYTVTDAACPTYNKTITVTVNPTPVLSLSAPPTICSGNSTTLTASGTSTYAWSTGAATASITVSPATTTTYTVNGNSAAGCPAAQQQITVTVNPTPTISVSATSPTICSGSSTTLNASGASSYTWSTGGVGSSITVSPVSNTTYTVNGTSAAGCPASAQTVAVTVNTTPTVSVSAASPTICSGNSTILNASGAATYSWSTGQTGSSITVSPASTETYTVTGTTTGCAGAAKTVTVNVNPTPTVSLSATATTICTGNPTTLNASGASTYSWSTGAVGSSITVSPAGTSSYTVTGTSAAGCPGTPQTITITVGATPTVTVSSSSPTICSGNSATLTASGATTYAWSNGATGSSITVSPASTTTYTVNGANGTCNASPENITVTVNTTPTLTVSAPPTICSGNSTTLTASGTTSYSWSSGQVTSSISVSPVTTTTYTINGTSSGCPAAPRTITVTVNTTPTLSVSASSPTICSGASSTLNASGAANYTWNTGATTSSITVSPAVTTTYTVNGNSSGCAAVSPETVTVTVNTTPSVTASATSPTICSGNPTTLNANGAVSYTWSTGQTGSSISVSPVVTTTYTVTGTTVGCGSTPQTITITVNSTPTVNVSASSPTICSGNSTALNATGSASYVWSTGATGSTINVSPNTTTTYTVTGTTVGCGSAPATITVNVNTTPTVSISPGATTICAPPTGNANLTASGAPGGNYVWSPATGLSSSTGATVNASPTASTTYTVTGTSASGCPSAPQTIAVTVAPQLVITIGPLTPAICSGDSIVLTANGASTYIWKSDTGLTCTTCQTTKAGPDSTITYTVIGSQGGCSDSSKVTLTVNPTPVISIGITGIAPTICPGDSMGMYGIGAGTGGTYIWSPSTGLSCTNCDTTNSSPNSTLTYTVTGTTASGCSSTSTNTMIVWPRPVITMNEPNPVICQGDTVDLNASGVSSYSWSPGTWLNTTVGPSVIANPDTTMTYVVKGKGTGGCLAYDTITVTVNVKPAVTVTPPTPAVCIGSSITLNANGASTYLWNNGGATSSITISPTTTGIDTVFGFSPAGCEDTATVMITVNPLPVIGITPPTPFICQSDTISLTASGAGFTGTYAWSPSTGLNPSYDTSTVAASPSVTTTY